MQYTLSEKEMADLVNKKDYKEVVDSLTKCSEKLNMALHYFRSGGDCDKIKYNGYCDNCPISSIYLKKGMKICADERYSK